MPVPVRLSLVKRFGVPVSEQLSIAQRAILVSVALSVVVAAALSGVVGGAAAIVVLAAFAAGWRYVPGFWRMVLSAAIGGVIAGLLVLGPGFRVAMRVVAIMSTRPTIVPEFTIGGTLFIVVFVGAMLGGTFAVAAALIRRAFGLSAPVTAGLMAVALIGMLLLDTGLRGEFVELGAGPWFNIPMFGGVVFAYGLAANRIMDRVETFRSRQPSREPAGVPG
jgi:hypothetical protein